MSEFEDSFNAAGRRRSRMARNNKIIQINKGVKPVGTPKSIASQLADEATRNEISRPVRQPWFGIDGFDNASGSSMSMGKKALVIGVAVLVIAGFAYMITTRLDKKAA
jgi:hypothetical protein